MTGIALADPVQDITDAANGFAADSQSAGNGATDAAGHATLERYSFQVGEPLAAASTPPASVPPGSPPPVAAPESTSFVAYAIGAVIVAAIAVGTVLVARRMRK
ncbi:MAG: hypothetical protein ACYDCK_02055 [Thermoplasmatota archaeon]